MKNTTKKFYGRAPLRLGLAGGGSDLKEHFLLHGGAVTNITINQYAHVFLEDNNGLEFRSHDLAICEKYADLNDLKSNIKKSDLTLHCMTVSFLAEKFDMKIDNLKVSSYVDAPPGSGLGSSSTLVVSLLLSIAKFFDIPISKHDAALYAYEIERINIGLAGGMQDQFSAAFGGCNFIEFMKSGEVRATPIMISKNFKREFEYSFSLFNIGQSRDSASIIKSQIESRQNKKNVENTNLLKRYAYNVRDYFLKEDIQSIHSSIHETWKIKKSLSNKISNKKIDEIYDFMLARGAISYKVSGAGGGGFILVGTNPEDKLRVIQDAEFKFNIKYMNFKIESNGFEGHFRRF